MPGTPSPRQLFIWSRGCNRDNKGGKRNIYIQKLKKSYSVYSVLFPVIWRNVSVALACSGIWDVFPQAAAHSRASGSPAVASQAEDRDARPRCPPPGIRQARSQRNSSSTNITRSDVSTCSFQIQQDHMQSILSTFQPIWTTFSCLSVISLGYFQSIYHVIVGLIEQIKGLTFYSNPILRN